MSASAALKEDMKAERQIARFHLKNKSRNVVTLFEKEEVKWHWDERDLIALADMWEKGLSLPDIAKAFQISEYETVLALIHCDLEGMIKPRPGGIFGKRRKWEDDEQCED